MKLSAFIYTSESELCYVNWQMLHEIEYMNFYEQFSNTVDKANSECGDPIAKISRPWDYLVSPNIWSMEYEFAHKMTSAGKKLYEL